MGLLFKEYLSILYSMENNQEIKQEIIPKVRKQRAPKINTLTDEEQEIIPKVRKQRVPKLSNLTDEERKLNKTLVHRKAVIVWKQNHRDQHLEHRKREYNYKKIKFIFLNILL